MIPAEKLLISYIGVVFLYNRITLLQIKKLKNQSSAFNIIHNSQLVMMMFMFLLQLAKIFGTDSFFYRCDLCFCPLE